MNHVVMKEILAGVPKEADTVEGGVTRNTVSAAPSTDAGEDPFKKSELGVGRKDGSKGGKRRRRSRRGGWKEGAQKLKVCRAHRNFQCHKCQQKKRIQKKKRRKVR